MRWVGPWRKRRQDFPHLSRKKGECASCQQCLQFVFCGFWIFSGEVFLPQKSAYSRRRFFRIYIYIYKIYIYILGFVCDVLTGAFAHVNKFFVTHIRWFVCEVLARWF